MTITLRPYQTEALDEIWQALQVKTNVLVQASCSAGKTILFAKIIQRLLRENPDYRAVIMADREILVQQAWEKLKIVAPELDPYIGFCCASISPKKETMKPVTIASRQSMAGSVDAMKAVNLVIFDEVHLVGLPVDGQPLDQFGRIFQVLRDKNQHVRLLGVTATPYRLSQGYCYGDRNRADSQPYFDRVDSRITTKSLLTQGFLAPVTGYIAKDASMAGDLSTVGKVAGEYNMGELEAAMMKEIHLQSVVDAYQKYCANRRCTVIFCTSIKHCESVAEMIPGAVAVHSQNDNHIGMDARVFVSVAKLTTGVDRTDIDALIIARATMSPALHVQMIGRAMRLHPGKENAIVVDIVGNTERFGLNLDDPVVKIPNTPGGGEAPSKICPGKNPDGSACAMRLHASVRVCPHCGQVFTAEEVEALLPDLKKVAFNEPEPPETLDVEEMLVCFHVSQASGKKMLRVDFSDGAIFGGEKASAYLGFSDEYSGFFLEKSAALWGQLCPDYPMPDSAEEAFEVQKMMIQPSQVIYRREGKFKNILEVIFTEKQEVTSLDDIPF